MIFRTVDVNGRRLHIISSGKSSPTVVLVNGAFAIDWALVQAKIDSIARICSCDWSEYGWNGAAPVDETTHRRPDKLREKQRETDPSAKNDALLAERIFTGVRRNTKFKKNSAAKTSCYRDHERRRRK